MNEHVTVEGEIVEGGIVAMSSSLAVQLQKAEVDQLVSTAHAYPRVPSKVQKSIQNMVTLDEESAEECMYALPRGGKPIQGPSIRFAEILQQAFGNCQAAARVVHVDKVEKFVEAEGVFIDFETNSRTTQRVRRRISDKNGKVYNDDMIIVTGNAACSIAKRNAILAGVPKPYWRRAYETAQATVAGDITTLSVNREKALKALANFGVTPEQIYKALGCEGIEDITVEHIVTLRGMFSALKNGEATVEEMFQTTVKGISSHQKVENALSDEPATVPADHIGATSLAEMDPQDIDDTPHDPETGEITGASAEKPETAHSSVAPNDADQAQEGPREQTDTPSSDASAADGDLPEDRGGQGDMLGETSVQRFVRVMNSLGNAGAIASEIEKQKDWIAEQEGDDAIAVSNAIARANERAKKRSQR